MILMKDYLIEEVKAGHKTETRRLWARSRVLPGSVHWICHKLFQTEPDCRVKILSVHTEKLRDITPDGVRAEGFAHGDVKLFLKGFREINAKKSGKHGPRWNPDLFVVRFELYEPEPSLAELTRQELLLPFEPIDEEPILHGEGSELFPAKPASKILPIEAFMEGGSP
jgi:hypothetical protein